MTKLERLLELADTSGDMELRMTADALRTYFGIGVARIPRLDGTGFIRVDAGSPDDAAFLLRPAVGLHRRSA